MATTPLHLRTPIAYWGAAILVMGAASALFAGGATRSAPRQEFPAGAWVVEARAGNDVLLARQPEVARGPRTAQGPAGVRRQLDRPDPPVAIVVWSAGSVTSRQTATAVQIEVPGQARPISARQAALGGRPVLFTPVGGGPRLLASPANPSNYVFARAGHLWQLSSDGSARRLTSDAAGDFDRRVLHAREAERDESYLIWADSPMWSPGGDLIVFVTNRESIAAGTQGGQSIWLLNPAAGAERPLLEGRTEWFVPVAWSGDEFLFATAGRVIGAVNARTGARRDVARGLPLAASDTGGRVAVAEYPEPGRANVSILVGGESISVPPAPSGYAYGAGARFSPSGNSLVLIAATDDGRTSLVVFDIGARRVAEIEMPDVPAQVIPTDPPQWLDEGTLLVNVVENATRQERALVLPVPTP